MNELLKTIALIIRGWIKERNKQKAAKNANDVAGNLANGGRVRKSELTASELATKSKHHSDE
ncbi:hypothetical protein [Vibrio sp. YQ_11]|uniref:hypothetical protein n=1 Tax=Vibrio sp. YQ_11 TaxID=3367233 RepID=UPI00370A0E1D|nr:hypothetical protein [Vibrio parahaemolyticus]